MRKPIKSRKPEWSQKRHSTWTNKDKEEVPIEVYEGKEPKERKNLVSYLQRGYRFSQERARQIRSSINREAAKRILGELSPELKKEYHVVKKMFD